MRMSKKGGRNTMARELILSLNKKTSSFAISKIDRKKLYGFKKRLYLDEKGRECSRANLEEETGICAKKDSPRYWEQSNQSGDSVLL